MLYNIARCPGVSSPIATMVGMDVSICSTCLRHSNRVLGSKTPFITPRLQNGCSHYIEACYVDFEEIKNHEEDDTLLCDDNIRHMADAGRLDFVQPHQN